MRTNMHIIVSPFRISKYVSVVCVCVFLLHMFSSLINEIQVLFFFYSSHFLSVYLHSFTSYFPFTYPLALSHSFLLFRPDIFIERNCLLLFFLAECDDSFFVGSLYIFLFTYFLLMLLIYVGKERRIRFSWIHFGGIFCFCVLVSVVYVCVLKQCSSSHRRMRFSFHLICSFVLGDICENTTILTTIN